MTPRPLDGIGAGVAVALAPLLIALLVLGGSVGVLLWHGSPDSALAAQLRRLAPVILLLDVAVCAAAWYRLRRVLLEPSVAFRQALDAAQARQAEAERQAALAEEQRAQAIRQKEDVEQTHRNIALLSEIGPLITASLVEEAIVETLYLQVEKIMDATLFGVGIIRQDQDQIEVRNSLIRGKRVKPWIRYIGDVDPTLIRCIRGRQTVLVNHPAEDVLRYGCDIETVRAVQATEMMRKDGTPAPPLQSWLYIPLLAKDRIMGVIAMYSFRQNAYRQMDVDILGSLATYAAVALENAHTYRQLQETQRQLVQQETMASLGRLVAGVAHEANTPIGNIRMSASAAHQRIEQFDLELESGGLRRSALKEFIGFLRESIVVIEHSSTKAADLISNFKQLAVDQSSLVSRRFEVSEVLDIVARSMANALRKAQVTMEVRADAGSRLFGDPGRFEQMMLNFITNAIEHGFDGRPSGTIVISVQRKDGSIEIRFTDDGNGIAPDIRTKIFEPYFTTRFGRGGSGLGLYIVHNIVTGVFSGTIEVDSVPGKGTTFTVEMPAAD